MESGSPCVAHTAAGNTVTADALVVATGAPFDSGVTMHLKVAAYLTYAVALEVPPGYVPPALYWDTVYRDDRGTVHEMSAACPHLGAVVQWNPGEKTWDCPCHGSRFTCTGGVQHGPAASNLKPVEEHATAGASSS